MTEPRYTPPERTPEHTGQIPARNTSPAPGTSPQATAPQKAHAPSGGAAHTRTRTLTTPKIIAIVLVLLVLAAALVSALTLCSAVPGREDGVGIGAGVKQGSPTVPKTAEPGENGEGTFSVQLNAEPRFASGTEPGNLNIANPKTNTLSITVSITLVDTGEVIYESGLIPPDHYIGDDALSVDLPPGEYRAKATVSPFDPDNPDRTFNQAGFDLKITIEA